MDVKQSDPEVIDIADLWICSNQKVWEGALHRYWEFVKQKNMDVEKSLNMLQLDRIRGMNAEAWYDFLHDEYFVWKYTAANRLASTRKHLKRYKSENALESMISMPP